MRTLIVYIAAVLILSGCTKDFLEKTDLTGIDERVWDEESTATLFLNRTYDLVMPMFPHMRSANTVPTNFHVISDESNTGDNRIMYGTVGIDNVNDFFGNNSNNAWVYIRRVNIMLDGLEKGILSTEVKDKLKAQALFLRAWVYFNLVKLYGGVPIITVPQDWVTDDLFVPRNKTSECIDFIVSDLDAAAALLPSGMPATQGAGDRGRITKDLAIAVKGRVLLYWASPQFNPNNDVTRWERAYTANKTAFETLTTTGYALFGNYEHVLTDEGTANREVIFIRSYDGTNKANSFEHGCRPVSETNGSGGGLFQPTWDLVKAYPMADGKPSMANGAAVNGFDTLYYWKNRDPRFAASIAYNGCVWELSGKTGRRQWNYIGVAEDKNKQTATGFYNRRGVKKELLALNSPMGTTDWVEMRFAEVILNLAECAAMTNRISEAYDMMIAIRKRAGIAQGSDPGYTYGLPTGMNAQDMADAIIAERRIEFAMEGKRHDDLRRTRRFHLLNGSRRYGLQIDLQSGKTAAQLETKDANGVMQRDKLNLDGADYATWFKPKLVILDTQQPVNFLDNYYFYAIPTANIRRNTNLAQTQGWTDGTFNPLE